MSVNVWDQVLAKVEAKVNRHSYFTWFKPTGFVADDGVTLTVRVPNPLFKDWLTKHYAVVLEEALQEVGRPEAVLAFQSSDADMPVPEAPVQPHIEATISDAPTGVAQGLNPRYTFDTFIVGPSNQFAHAACRAVAEAPSLSYNPLFIYGGVGLGKTHLMHAIGQYVVQHGAGLRLTYISSERFMNEMINAVRYDRILEFRERYRSVDVLLVDDIQFVAGKEGTQNEFFHTFNALYDAQKQIILSSDRPPHELLPTMPPMVARDAVETSTGNQRPCGFSWRLRSSSTMPGSTRQVRLDTSRSSRRLRCREPSITMPVLTVWPHWEVPPPRAVMGIPASRAMSSVSLAAAIVRGTTTPAGMIW